MGFIVVLVYIMALVAAYFITKIPLTMKHKIFINAGLLLLYYLAFLVKRVEPETGLIYLFLIMATVLGIVIRLIVVPLFNFINHLAAKVNKETYQNLSFEELMEDDYLHHMFSCRLLFIATKLVMHFWIIISFFAK